MVKWHLRISICTLSANTWFWNSGLFNWSKLSSSYMLPMKRPSPIVQHKLNSPGSSCGRDCQNYWHELMLKSPHVCGKSESALLGEILMMSVCCA